MQRVGAAYDRQIIAFSVTTPPEQDDALIAEMSGESSTIQCVPSNCADFVRDLLSRYCNRGCPSVGPLAMSPLAN